MSKTKPSIENGSVYLDDLYVGELDRILDSLQDVVDSMDIAVEGLQKVKVKTNIKKALEKQATKLGEGQNYTAREAWFLGVIKDEIEKLNKNTVEMCYYGKIVDLNEVLEFEKLCFESRLKPKTGWNHSLMSNLESDKFRELAKVYLEKEIESDGEPSIHKRYGDTGVFLESIKVSIMEDSLEYTVKCTPNSSGEWKGTVSNVRDVESGGPASEVYGSEKIASGWDRAVDAIEHHVDYLDVVNLRDFSEVAEAGQRLTGDGN